MRILFKVAVVVGLVVVVKSEPLYYPSNPYGYWETLGFGLFAIYKSDFDRIGGMDVQTFKQWGGEDWELLDRVLMSGMEVERRKVPAFYHFYHKPLGSFNQRNDT